MSRETAHVDWEMVDELSMEAGCPRCGNALLSGFVDDDPAQWCSLPLCTWGERLIEVTEVSDD